MNGDTAIIKKQEQARDGEIVVALVDNNEATLKKIRKDGNIIQLIPCNKEYKTQTYSANRISIQGILSGIIRKYWFFL